MSHLFTTPYDPNKGVVCLCSTRHSPSNHQVLQAHHVWPKEYGGPSDITQGAAFLWLCASAHEGCIHPMLTLMVQRDAEYLHPAERFGNTYCYEVAQRGYRCYKAQAVVL
jgi:hypothetical protein